MNEFSITGYVDIMFLKVDPDLKVVKGEEYTLMPIDEELEEGIVLNSKNDVNNSFFLRYDFSHPVNTALLYKVIPKTIRNDLESINTLEQIEALCEKDSGYHLVKDPTYHKYRLVFTIPMRFKQTKGIDGYKKNNIIYSSEIYAIFNYDDNNTITNRTIQFGTWNSSLGIIQGNDLPSYTKISDINKFKSNDIQKSCINTDDQGKIITSSEQCNIHINMGSGEFVLIPYFINREGTVNLKITNTVNGLARYNASKDNKLQYRIEVTNIGDASSGNNIITTNVPKLVKVDINSISNNGVYNKKNNTISWNIAHIDVGEKVQVSYRATAPESAKNKELVGNSTVKSDQVTNTVRSTNTVVTLERIVEIIKNPDTGTMIHFVNTNITLPVNFVISVVLILSIVSFLIVRKFHLKKEKTTI